MTIKEVESLCGMTRANIRFYESEGLLTPSRNQNGYRDYSEKDAEVLKRINLERSPEYPVPELEEDAIPKETVPWRRFFARNLDMVLYSTLWSLFLVCVCNVNLNDRGLAGELLDAIATIVLLFLFEPALLALCGTTPGKWIMGLRVTDYEDRRLTYSEAGNRTFTVFWKGMGLEIPIYSLYRNWKSYQDCEDGETLEWERETCITLRDKKNWRIWALVAAYGVIFVGLFWGISSAQMPKHRGDITVVEFCENYNRLADYYGMDQQYDLTVGGKWLKRFSNGGVVHIGGFVERPELIFTKKNGVMTGVEFSLTLENSENWPPSYQEQMMLLSLAFVCAQEECSIFSDERSDMLRLIEDNKFKSFTFSYFGVEGSCQVEYAGYEDVATAMNVLWPKEGEKNRFEMKFRLEKK